MALSYVHQQKHAHNTAVHDLVDAQMQTILAVLRWLRYALQQGAASVLQVSQPLRV